MKSTHSNSRSLTFISMIIWLSTSLAATSTKQPSAPVRPVTDDYFGVQVRDPYRWLENTHSEEVRSYLKAQMDYTESVLAHFSVQRGALLTRIHELDAATDSVPIPASYEEKTVFLVGKKLFYKKTKAGHESAGIYTKSLGGNDERLLVGAARFNASDGHASISYFLPSPDGHFVAFGISQGSEVVAIYVLDSKDGSLLPEIIPNNTAANIAWIDGTHFSYVRQPNASLQTKIATYDRPSVYIHTLRADYKVDRMLFGYGYSALIPFAADDFAFVTHAPGSDYLVAVMTHGDQYGREVLYAASVADTLAGKPIRWRRITSAEDAVDDFAVHDGIIYVLSHKTSPRREIRAFSLRDGGYANSVTVVPTSERVITGLGVARNGLYVTDLDGGTNLLRRLAYSKSAVAKDVTLPYAGTITVATDPRTSDVLVSDVGWTHSGLWFYLSADGEFTDTRIQPLNTADFSQIVAEEVRVPSTGGVQVPLSIVHMRGLRMDGSHPTWLEGYGAYGGALTANFDPSLLAWLERGGVYAVAHVRGGGELGEAWHQDGMLAKKQHGVEDFIACAGYLIDNKYTSSTHLAAVGASAGGLLVGGAITQRPDEFAAVLDIVGMSDTLRFMQSPNGQFNAWEFGDIHTEEGFKALYSVDPYQQVRDGVRYPAVWLTGGMEDSRVPVWEPVKMAARLQAATTSGRPVLLYVNSQGGHGLSQSRAMNEQQKADQYVFLFWQLGDPDFGDLKLPHGTN